MSGDLGGRFSAGADDAWAIFVVFGPDYRDPLPTVPPRPPPAFLAAADCARGAAPLAAVDEPGLRAAADCIRDAAFPVMGEDLLGLFPLPLLAISYLPVAALPTLYTQASARGRHRSVGSRLSKGSGAMHTFYATAGFAGWGAWQI
jgi:hypothetical protein